MAVKRIPRIGEGSGDGKPAILQSDIAYSAGSYTAPRTCWVLLTAVGGGAGGEQGGGTGGAGGAALLKVFRLFKGQSFSWIVGGGGAPGMDGNDTIVSLPTSASLIAGKGVFGARSTAVGGDLNRSGGGSGENATNGGLHGGGGGGYAGGGGAAGFRDLGAIFTALNLDGGSLFASYNFGKGGDASDHGDGASGLVPGGGGGSAIDTPGRGANGEVRYIVIAI